MRTNIFRSAHEQPENKLTYCFLALLEHLDFKLAAQLIAGSGISADAFERLQVELLYGGKRQIRTGVWRLTDRRQISRYISKTRHGDCSLTSRRLSGTSVVHMNNSLDCRLLMITTDKGHARELAAVGDSPHLLHDLASGSW